MSNYDDHLCAIEHYQRYQMMKPWIGSDYSSQQLKLLVLGESHYVNKHARFHHDEVAWYNGVEVPQKFQRGISTRLVLGQSLAERWKRKSSVIYRNIETALMESGVLTADGTSPIHAIAYMNYFQRPAQSSGQSLKHGPLDRLHSAAVVDAVVDILLPDLIVVCRYAYAQVQRVERQTDIDRRCAR
ncbi:hypothetical protein GTP44_25615 [Duganella sp. FT50W]|uniref:Uncharacterized protein n=1 Tax=Duganella lactea TaxID=2692173 RepID=A0A6L8MTB3_9BURK|nr:hypothetical protein [Duganella lactea]MYM85303.1 hypothetical protein [Duganella lactea]